MEIFFLILTAGIAGYVAYTFLFVRKGPPHKRSVTEGSPLNENLSASGSAQNSATFKQEELDELEAILLAVIGGDSMRVPEPTKSPEGREAVLLSPQSMMGAFHAWALKTLFAEERRARMQARCLHEFPEMLDILTLGLKAGLSFDGSLELYTSRYSSMLSRLLSQCMIVWKLGLSSRVDALEAVSSHLRIGAFTRFSMAVTEALEFGIPLADSLARQATEIRREQRLQVEEGIEKIPVKMLIPMGVFVVPAMLLAILGPLLSSALKVG